MIVNDALGKLWHEEVVAYFKVLSQQFFAGTEEYRKNPRLRESNPGPSEHVAKTDKPLAVWCSLCGFSSL